MRSERGVVLMQVMIMGIILATVAVMLVQWQFGRYVMAAKVENNARSRALILAAYHKASTKWISERTDPTGSKVKVEVYDSVTGENVDVYYTVTGSPPNRKVSFEIDSAQFEY